MNNINYTCNNNYVARYNKLIYNIYIYNFMRLIQAQNIKKLMKSILSLQSNNIIIFL